MKHLYRIGLLFFGLFALTNFASGQNAWINEFHYDDASGDQNEMVEIVIENASSYTLSDFVVTKYNGSGGASYGSDDVSTFIVGDVYGDFTLYYIIYPTNGLQNGAPEGLDLSYQGTSLQFLSYEGTLTAVGGPADGLTSIDVGVSESGSVEGSSLQLAGSGTLYSNFTWQDEATATPGIANNDQTIGADETAPSFTSGPTAVNITGNGFQVTAQSDEDATLYYVIDDSGTPTAQEIKDGQLSGGATATYAGSLAVLEAEEGTVTISGLASATAYDIHFTMEDAAGNLTAVSTLTDVTTAAADAAAPVYQNSTPSASSITDVSFDLTVQFDEIGTAYYVVVADGSTPAPSSAQVMAGTDGSDAAAIASGTIDVTSASMDFSSSISGLSVATAYDVYVVSVDDETTPNVQATPSMIDVSTTTDTTPPTVESAATSVSDVSYDVNLTMSENVTATDESGFTININGNPATISDFGVVDNSIGFLLNEPIYAGDVITVDYDDTQGDVADLAANALASFTDQAVINNATTVLVDDIATLRTGATDGTVYQLGGSAIVHSKQSFRNQKWIQDGTAAILINDNPNGNFGAGYITTDYQIGDEIPGGLTGTLDLSNGQLKFEPIDGYDPGTALSTGNEVAPQVMALSTYNANYQDLESQLITVEAVTFSDAGTGFSNGVNYDIVDGGTTGAFRTEVFAFSGNDIPYGRVDITSPAGRYNTTPQLLGQSITDIVDNYAPQFTVAPAIVNVYTDGADITFQADEPGTVYYVVQLSGTAAPTVGDIFVTGTTSGYTAVGTETGFTIFDLADGQSYDLYIAAEDDETSPNQQSAYVLLELTIPEITNDENTDITALASPIAQTDISSLADTDLEAVDVFGFTLTDEGTDGVSTFVDGIVITAGTNNTADWSTTIAGAVLSDGTTDITLTVDAGSMYADLSSAPYELANNTAQEFTLSIWLNTSVTDGDVLEFEIGTSHLFSATIDGSLFLNPIASAVTSAQHTVDVEATAFVLDYPISVGIDTDFDLTVTAEDENGNLDNVFRSVSLTKETGPGNLSSVNFLTDQAMIGGSITFQDLQLDAAGDYTLTAAESGGLAATTETISASSVITNVEDFSNFPETSSSYNTGTFTGNDGSTWSYVKTSGNSGEQINAPSPILGRNQSPAAEVTSGTISGGIGVLSFDYQQAFSTNVNLEVYVNDELITTVTTSSEQDVLKNSGDVAVDISGDFVLSFRQPSGAGQVTIDNITWTTYSGTSPSIVVDQSSFDGVFGSVIENETSESRSYFVSGSNLTENITIAAPSGFSVSTDNSTFTPGVTLTQEDGTVSSTEVFVRFEPTSVQSYSGTITHTSAGANQRTVEVSGSGISANVIFVEDFASCPSGQMTTFSVASNQDWGCTSNGNSNNAMEANGFGGDVASDDWLITPAIDLSEVSNAVLSFYSWTQFSDAIHPPLTVKASTDYSGSGDPTVANWTDLSAILAAQNSTTWTASGDVDLTPYIGGNVYIAFRYTTTGTSGSTTSAWRIDDVIVEEGVAVATPFITLVDDGFNGAFGFVEFGNQSEVSSYTITATDLSEDLIVTPPTGFELSATAAFDGTVYTNSSAWVITPIDGDVNQEVFVRFNPAVADGAVYGGDINHESTGADSKTIPVSGQEGVLLPDLFFSEYLEGSVGTNKALEIYNGSGEVADLTKYQIQRITNGGSGSTATFEMSTISATMDAGAVIVIANSTVQEVLDAADLEDSFINHNGDDVYTLLKDGIIIDIIGENSGVDPGDGWEVAGVADGTKDHVLVRKPSVSQGNPVALASFGTSEEDSEWIVLSDSETSGLGSHGTEQEGDPIITVTSSISTNFGVVQAGSTVEQAYSVSAVDLLGDLTITAPSGFLVSTDGSTFTASVDLSPTDGTVESTTITVQFAPDAEGEFTGSISHESTDALTKTLAVSGTAVGDDVIYFENFSSCDALNTMTSQSISGDEVWECTPNGETGGGARMNGYSGGAQDNLDWLITQGIDLSAVDAANLSFDSDVRYDGPALEVYVSSDYTNDADAATWTKLTVVLDEDSDNFDTWTSSGDIDLSDYTGSTIYIGFLYTSSTVDGAATWSIDNVKVTETQPFLSTDVASLGDFNQVDVGSVSANKSFTVEGFGLTADVIITPPAQFEVSTTSNFAAKGTSTSALTISPTDGAVDQQVFVRFAPTAAGSFSGNVTVESTGFDDITLSVSGAGVDDEEPALGLDDELDFVIYPNPVKNVFEINNHSGKSISVEVFALDGAKMSVKKTGNTYDISSLNSGVYVIVITDENSAELAKRQIIKE
ncbi:choice-of-anchor J domain-containing protein [Ekhidna sp.]|uniref:choice-of-anchor J domain-containing protein n=1 Tax=Ekhidna sp. TaxID=2608089 RepID=UPI003512B0E9